MSDLLCVCERERGARMSDLLCVCERDRKREREGGGGEGEREAGEGERARGGGGERRSREAYWEIFVLRGGGGQEGRGRALISKIKLEKSIHARYVTHSPQRTCAINVNGPNNDFLIRK